MSYNDFADSRKFSLGEILALMFPAIMIGGFVWLMIIFAKAAGSGAFEPTTAYITGNIKGGQLVCSQKEGSTQLTTYDFGMIKQTSGSLSVMPLEDCKTIFKLEVKEYKLDRYPTNEEHVSIAKNDTPKIGQELIVKSDDKKSAVKNIGEDVKLYCTWDTTESYGEWDKCRLVQ